MHIHTLHTHVEAHTYTHTDTHTVTDDSLSQVSQTSTNWKSESKKKKDKKQNDFYNLYHIGRAKGNEEGEESTYLKNVNLILIKPSNKRERGNRLVYEMWLESYL